MCLTSHSSILRVNLREPLGVIWLPPQNRQRRYSASLPASCHPQQLRGLSYGWWHAVSLATPACCCCCPAGPRSACSPTWPSIRCNVNSRNHDHSKHSGRVNGSAFDSQILQIRGSVTAYSHCVNTLVVVHIQTQPSSALTRVPGSGMMLCCVAR